jgi:RNA polymerase sigma-70 factor (ECF subfamily)
MTRAGNQGLLDRLVAEELPKAFRFALRLTGSQDAAEEVVQEALCRAIRAADSFRGQSQFRTWFYRIVINAFSDHLAAAARHRSPGELTDDMADPNCENPSDATMAGELRDLIARRISALPSLQREVMGLTTYEQMRPLEVAEVLGISASNVHVTMHRARARLREELRPYLAGDERDRRPEKSDRELDALSCLLTQARWPEPRPEAIRRLHAQWQLLVANPPPVSALAISTKTASLAVVFTVAIAVPVCVWLSVSHFTSRRPGAVTFAQTLKQIEEAKNITWKYAQYTVFSKDGNRTRHAGMAFSGPSGPTVYKAPGVSRETAINAQGQVSLVQITDKLHGKQLKLFPLTKTAVLSVGREVAGGYDYPEEGPFDWAKNRLKNPKDLQWVDTRKTPSGEVDVFRYVFTDRGRDISEDFWIDAKTKQLVAVFLPGADVYDPVTDPMCNALPEKAQAWGFGWSYQNIVFDGDLDDSLFRLEPPAGYKVEVKYDHVTERMAIDYLGLLAELNDKTFPDQLFPVPANLLSKIDRALDKPRKDLTAAERKLLDGNLRYISPPPILVFVAWNSDRTVERSFRYLGYGVKLGDKDRIVCWYKLKGAKGPKAYRVVYGDLSVKDVSAESLPLPAEP